MAVTYALPGALPAGCSGSGTSYSCGDLVLAWQDRIDIVNPGTTLTINGNLTTANNDINRTSGKGGFTLQVSGSVSGSNGITLTGNLSAGGDVTLANATNLAGNAESTSGALSLASNATVTGSVKAKNDISLGSSSIVSAGVESTSGQVTLASSVKITGSIKAQNDISVGSGSSVSAGVQSTNGKVTLQASSVTVTGDISAKNDISLGSSSIVNGNILSTNGGVTVNPSSVSVTGSITAQENIILGSGTKIGGSVESTNQNVSLESSSVTVTGCVKAKSQQTITLGWAATVGGVCCANGSSCDGSCVANNSGKTYGLCFAGAPVSLVAQYRMDESAWNGTTGEVRDSSGANHATAKEFTGLTPTLGLPTTESAKICKGGRFKGDYNQKPGFTGHANYYVEAPDADALSPLLFGSSHAMTLTGWFNVSSDNSYTPTTVDQSLLYKGNGWTDQEYRVYVSSGHVYVWIQGYWNRTSLIDLGAFSPDNWYFFAVSAALTNGRYLKTEGHLFNASGRVGSMVTDNTDFYTNILSLKTSPGTLVKGMVKSTSNWLNNPLNGWLDEVKVFDGALNTTQVETVWGNEVGGRNWDGSERICQGATVDPKNFNAFDGSCPASGITGVIKTKVAGKQFSLPIVALKDANSDGAADGVESAFTGDVKVELVDASDNAVACGNRGRIGSSGTITFASTDSGCKLVDFTENNAWRNVAVRMTYPATGTAKVTACSTDLFAIRPNSFGVLVQDGDWQTAGTARTLDNTTFNSGGVTHKAGRPFTLTATAYNGAATSAVASNYAGSATLMPSACSGTACPSSLGSLSSSTLAFTSGSGQITPSYSEVGAFGLTLQDGTFAAVDANDGTSADCNGLYICSSLVNVGRFVPDHFAITPGTVAPACASGNFTYFGQDGFSTPFTLTAQNAANATTANYAGTFARLGLGVWSNFIFTDSGVTLLASATAPSGTWSNGVASVTARHWVARPASPVAEASVNVKAQPVDQDGVTMASAASVQAAVMAMRYGRVRLLNANGSELLDLPMPLRPEYWNGRWVNHTDDKCTGSGGVAGNVSLSASAVSASWLSAVSPYRPCVHDSGSGGPSGMACTAAAPSSPIDKRFRMGAELWSGSDPQNAFNLWLAAPGAGNTGTIRIAASVPDWLKFKWDGSSDANPVGLATFGQVRSGRVIYRRELY